MILFRTAFDVGAPAVVIGSGTFFRLRSAAGIWSIAGLLLCAFGTLQTQESRAAQKVLAQAPPMGWNSWDSYGLRIDEQQFRDNVDTLATQLKPFGYQYAVIDEGWYMANPEDRPKPELL